MSAASRGRPRPLVTLLALLPGAAAAQDAARPMVFFDWNSAALSGDAKAALDAVAAQAGTGAITLVAHSDRSGSRASSRVMARRRADAVRAYLIERGIAGERIAERAEGDAHPLIPTADGVREAQNRRVDILIR